jgi:hypothetical protein
LQHLPWRTLSGAVMKGAFGDSYVPQVTPL